MADARPGVTPMFNAGLAYLDRLDTLHRAIHQAFDENDLPVARRRIRLLQAELRKRADPEQIAEMTKKMKKVGGVREQDLNNDFNRTQYEEGLLDWYDYINDVIKEQKLELQDRAGDADAVGSGLF